MRTEGDYIKINDWLLPLSWLYGLGVGFRNWLFDLGVLKNRAFAIPIIAVGNITVGEHIALALAFISTREHTDLYHILE